MQGGRCKDTAYCCAGTSGAEGDIKRSASALRACAEYAYGLKQADHRSGQKLSP